MRLNRTSLYFFSFAFVLCSFQLKAQYITTFAGVGTGGYTGDGGPCFEAELNNPTSIATYGYVTQYIADQANHVIRKVDYLHNISTFAGNATGGNNCDNCNATSTTLMNPYGVAVDAFNNVYIADYGANVVRKVNTSGIINTVAGNDTSGYSGDGGQAIHAKLNHPYGVALDAAGNLYISDAQNNVIRKVTTSGIISTYAGTGYGAGLTAGNGGYTGDGGNATQAALNFPEGLTVDQYGNLYIADESNNAIRKVSASGIITTYAGTGHTGYTGDGGAANAAQLNYPTGVGVDGSGNLYIADQGNNSIRKVSSTGTINTIAGNITLGYYGDGGMALSSELNHPSGLAVDGNGLVYVADYGNNVIRLIGPASIINAVKQVSSSSSAVKVYPNPSNGSFTVEIPQTSSNATITVMDVVGKIITTRSVDGSQAHKISFTLNNIPAGSYILKVDAGDYTCRDKLVIW